MITNLTSAALKDLVSHLKSNPDFLSLSEEDRAQKAPAYAAMVKGLNADTLLEDLMTTVKVLKGSAMASESHIVKSLGQFFVRDFPAIFDQLGSEFFTAKPEAQSQKLNELLPENAYFYSALKQVLMVDSAQEISEQVVQFLTEVFNTPRILVQSPVECDLETKTSIRKHYQQEYPQSFVAFSVNPQLIGGIRFFVDGSVVDHSWFGRIADIRRLHTLVSA